MLSDYLRDAGIPHEVSVATEYGKEILLESGEENLIVGRKNSEEIAEMIDSIGASIVVDATHPFATDASREIKRACLLKDVLCVRLKRSTEDSLPENDNIVLVDSMEDAARKAGDVDGNILILTGSKELEKIVACIADTSRLYARVLPNEESIAKCSRAGLLGKQIIAMQGPFSKQMNIATIREIGAKVIITKESGKAGGFREKIEAAVQCGIRAVVVRNPEELVLGVDGHSLEEVCEILTDHTGVEIRPFMEITLAGIGPGDESYYTTELRKALDRADIIFGAEAVLKNLKSCDVPLVYEYRGENILKYLEENRGYISPVVLFSGDISLCSGARKATEFFAGEGYRVKRIPGISSVTLFSQRLCLGLEDVRIVSAHGRDRDVAGYVAMNKEVIVLPSDAEHAKRICEQVKDMAEMVVVGCDLGTSEEKIIDIGPSEKASEQMDGIKGKCLVYIKKNIVQKENAVAALADSEIIRGNVPMTKEEIRALSIRKLELTRDAVLYDVGAGTGSISLEAALLDPGIRVYSIEKNEEAILLLRQNKEKFGAVNMEIVEGKAPQALGELPIPSHVFIGGSSGSIKEILSAVFNKNESARVVINTVTAETFAQVMDYVSKTKGIEPDIIQVSVSRFRKAGNYHLADALNPVYIITLKTSTENVNDLTI